VSRFIYWNMNYHVEHHMFPMVPYHALPRCMRRSSTTCPRHNASIAEGFREMWPALKRQLAHEDFFLRRELPPTARPYREDFHAAALGEAPSPAGGFAGAVPAE
jgi:fatty acid desaturase